MKKIKTMNIKKATNSQLPATESKKEKKTLSNNQNRNRSFGMEIIWKAISWEREGGEWEKWCRD